MTSANQDFIERMGLTLEEDGLPRIAGRIFGLLLLSDEPHSLDDLAAELQVSKGSVSTNARLLEQRGLLEQVCRPGDRRDYYRVPSELFLHTMALGLERWARFHATIASARASLPVRSPEVRERLDEYTRAYAFMSRVIREALTGWEESRLTRLDKVGIG